MKSILTKLGIIFLALLLSSSANDSEKDFQGKAYYFSKSTLDLGRWGARLSEAQKKQVQERLKNRLEKTYTLTFNKEESLFKEDDKLDAISGATDSWGKNFAAGEQYKNVRTEIQIQDQEFYGKRFLVKDNLQPITWELGSETKQIGNYTCFKAKASIPTNDLLWFSFSWDRIRNDDNESGEPNMTDIEAWYTPEIPVRHGPSEYWGLPGLILEVSAGDTTILCSKIVMNPEDKIKIEAPNKGKIVTKAEYQATIVEKMKEFRNNRMGRSRR
ncbi:GLPGLI family protein [Winogradskyella sp. 3972H.M.0a.05]|uniref:GLPGLI family protein n=1 Tax=Winogradskyella sp. 3972H.M.0a.05 TaxID=2950277 RepID=UPI0033931845